MVFGRLWQKGLLGMLGGWLLLIAACSRPQPPPLTADCNPLPLGPLPLPNFVESITYLSPELQGPVHSLHVEGDRVYLGLGQSFGILDTSNAAEPRLLGSLPLPGRRGLLGITNFSVRDNLAYFTQDGQNLTVDVSDPAKPVRVGCGSAVPWPAAESAFQERYFIANSFLGGIQIEERPLRRGGPVEVADFTAYTPAEVEWQQPTGQPVPLPALTERYPMYVRSYDFDDRYLYLLNVLRIPGDYCCGVLTVLDMKNPAEPDLIGTLQLPGELAPFAVKVAGDWLFINFYEPRGTNPAVGIYDISNKRKPKAITTVPSFGLPQVHNDYAYFPDNEAIGIWHLAEDDGPELVGRIDIPGITDAFSRQGENRLAFVGDYIYYAAVSRLAILNNEDPANPYLTAEMPFPLLPYVRYLAGSDGRLLGSINNLPYGNVLDEEVQMLPLAGDFDVESWLVLPEPETPAIFADVALDGRYAFAIDDESVVDKWETWLQIYYLDETAETTVTTYTLEDFEARRIAARYPYMYLLQTAAEAPALVTLDISNPANPVRVLEIALEPSDYQDLVVWEGSLYVSSTAENAGVWHFDISGPEPRLLEKLPFDLLTKITIGDGYLFGLNVTNQLEVIDLRPSTGPVLVGRYDVERGNAADLTYLDGVLYLALGERGVAAVKLNFDLGQ